MGNLTEMELFQVTLVSQYGIKDSGGNLITSENGLREKEMEKESFHSDRLMRSFMMVNGKMAKQLA